MTTAPGRAGRRIACGLAVIIAAFLTVLAGEFSAGAGTDAHIRSIQHAAGIRYIRNGGNTGNTGAAGSAKKAGKARKAVRPWTLSIPSIGVAVGLMTLGGPSGSGGSGGSGGLSLPVPPLAKATTEAGWYQFTAVPGSAGNAVIVGHVDTYVGPAAFYNLYLLRSGDSIYVDAGGTRQRFTVTSVSEMPKSSFPVNQVFGSTEKHALWLITCGGPFDYKTGHYLENIVVSAVWRPVADKKAHAKRSASHQETVRLRR